MTEVRFFCTQTRARAASRSCRPKNPDTYAYVFPLVYSFIALCYIICRFWLVSFQEKA